jgi:hypothetical protein
MREKPIKDNDPRWDRLLKIKCEKDPSSTKGVTIETFEELDRRLLALEKGRTKCPILSDTLKEDKWISEK